MEHKIIRKSNFLIEASYRLSLIEQRIVLFLASMIKLEDQEFKPYPLSIKDFADFLGIKNKNNYSQLKNATKKLLDRSFSIKRPGSTLQTNWVSSVEYLDGKGLVELSFDPKLKPYLLQLKERFTSYKLKEVIQLKSAFSIRFYELLKQVEKLQERTFEIEDLRAKLGIKPTQYKLYSNLKARVILVAQKELAEKTDISFEFEELKTGRSVTKLRFTIFRENPPPETRAIEPFTPNFQDILQTSDEEDQKQFNEELTKLFGMLPKVFQSKKTIEKLIAENLEKHDFDYVSRNILYTNKNSKAAKPGLQNAKGSNYRNYLSKALKEDFGLAFKEDLEAADSIEQAQKAKVAAEEQQKREEEAKIEAEREVALKAKEYLENLDPAQYEVLKKQAIRSLSPEDKEKLFEGRIQADYTVKRAMKKIAAEQLKLFPEK